MVLILTLNSSEKIPEIIQTIEKYSLEKKLVQNVAIKVCVDFSVLQNIPCREINIECLEHNNSSETYKKVAETEEYKIFAQDFTQKLQQQVQFSNSVTSEHVQSLMDKLSAEENDKNNLATNSVQKNNSALVDSLAKSHVSQKKDALLHSKNRSKAPSSRNPGIKYKQNSVKRSGNAKSFYIGDKK
ncbi:MAG: hypothetical protein MHPSP_004705 [Paramarteilia canceri]